MLKNFKSLILAGVFSVFSLFSSLGFAGNERKNTLCIGYAHDEVAAEDNGFVEWSQRSPLSPYLHLEGGNKSTECFGDAKFRLGGIYLDTLLSYSGSSESIERADYNSKESESGYTASLQSKFDLGKIGLRAQLAGTSEESKNNTSERSETLEHFVDSSVLSIKSYTVSDTKVMNNSLTFFLGLGKGPFEIYSSYSSINSKIESNINGVAEMTLQGEIEGEPVFDYSKQIIASSRSDNQNQTGSLFGASCLSGSDKLAGCINIWQQDGKINGSLRAVVGFEPLEDILQSEQVIYEASNYGSKIKEAKQAHLEKTYKGVLILNAEVEKGISIKYHGKNWRIGAEAGKLYGLGAGWKRADFHITTTGDKTAFTASYTHKF